MFGALTKVFGTYNSRAIKIYEKIVKKINALEEGMQKLSDDELKSKTFEFMGRLEKGEALDDLLPEAFAVVREASIRTVGMRHFDVQLIGGMVLHDGKIAEMKTGEGKTLVATLAVYLNALTRKGVHVVTVNDYLAKRDSEWMGQIYRFLGLTVSCITGELSDSQKKDAYRADISYGTNHEFGFDYLRDNLKFSLDEIVMRPFNFAVIDEVDSILVDEARTPLIISGVDQDSSHLYTSVNEVVAKLVESDYEKEEKTRVVTLTDQGVEKLEEELSRIGLLKGAGLYDTVNVALVHHVNSALKAHVIFAKDVDYIVKDGQVMIIDEFTGRIMDGRRYSEGLHQAIEAKEHVKIQTESQTVATISYQNLFRMYPKLSGMTGTAMTEEAEFDEIYKLKVVSVPSNKPVIRKDHEDSLFMTADEKYRAVVALIKQCHEKLQPVLVGTTSIEKSEYVSDLLTAAGIKHSVLNARHHEKEAFIIAEAGAPGAVTIATNMAGRGTDIKLGGSLEERIRLETAEIADPVEKQKKIESIRKEIEDKYKVVAEAGGLYIIATERNESRRIDNQLRGRAGRQGDPGESKYFLSLQDDLLRRFGGKNIEQTFKRIGAKENDEIQHRMLTKVIEKAQKRVEAYNFDIRKQLLKYDDVMNEQRKVIYEQRKLLMATEDVSDSIQGMMEEMADKLIDRAAPVNTYPDVWDLDGLTTSTKALFNLEIDFKPWAAEEGINQEIMKDRLNKAVAEAYEAKVQKYEAHFMRYIEKDAFLRVLDRAWRTHLLNIEHLRKGINLRAYAQKNPLNEYKFEAFALFQDMLEEVKQEVLTTIFHFEMSRDLYSPINNYQEPIESLANKLTQAPPREMASRNEPCFCGSGKKFKHCHGALPDMFAPGGEQGAPKDPAKELEDLQDQIKKLDDLIKEVDDLLKKQEVSDQAQPVDDVALETAPTATAKSAVAKKKTAAKKRQIQKKKAKK